MQDVKRVGGNLGALGGPGEIAAPARGREGL